MIWYLALLFQQVEDRSGGDENADNWVHDYAGPGTGSPIVEWVKPAGTPRYRVHAIDTVGETCLIGFINTPPSVPGDWVQKTIAETQTLFQNVVGRAPTAKEIC